MKRFHVNIAVKDIDRSIEFYRTLFGTEPDVVKEDYAKWMLEDPRVNFAISKATCSRGVNHVGLQAETETELEDIRARLHRASQQTLDQADAECCYARSTKTWVRDPDNVAWETFVTHGEISHFGEDRDPAGERTTHKSTRCCA